MIRATRYEILRQVEANGRQSLDLPEKPLRVATVLNESDFLARDGEIVHNTNVFLEDHLHDWNWKDGQFRYYTRVAEKADVLIVYEEVDDRPLRPRRAGPR